MKAYQCDYEGEVDNYSGIYYADDPDLAVALAFSDYYFTDNDDEVGSSDDIKVKRAPWADHLKEVPMEERDNILRKHGYVHYDSE